MYEKKMKWFFEKNVARWYLEHQTLGWRLICPSKPANQRTSESAHYIEDCRILRPYDIANVCSAEKLTKHSTVLLLCMVSFSEEQTLLHSSIKEWEKKSNEYSIDFKTRLNLIIDVHCVTLLDISRRVEIFRFSDCEKQIYHNVSKAYKKSILK